MGFLDLDGLRPHLTVYDWMQDSTALGAAQKQHSTKQNCHWRRKDILIYPEFWSCFATKLSMLHAYVRVITYIYIYTDYIHHIIHKNETALQLLKWKNQKVCTAWVAHQTGWKMIDPNMLQDGFLILDVSKKNWKPVWCFIHTLPSSWLDWEVQRRDCVGSASRTSAEPFKSSVNLFQPSTWCKVTKSSGGSKTVRKMPIGSNQHKDVISEKSSCISASSTYILASSWFLAHRSGMLFGWIQYFH